ncbi:hypothetical protein [Streptomyces sp. NPDC020681]|uniref:hypothetical protein n=1 Tax=Streptomyces sp. NPDC020681 TaxID=3365083 RepID=UPI003788ED63
MLAIGTGTPRVATASGDALTLRATAYDLADKRRALIAATVLLAGRPSQAQAALAHVLSFDLGAGPLTWLLTVLNSHLPDGPIDGALVEQLIALCRSDMLSVRAEASAILTRAGRQPPPPPATVAHPTLARAMTEDSA